MPTTIERHSILLSCPGDVDRLLPVVEKALQDFNQHYTESYHIELCSKHWSRDMYPKSGGKPQSLINRVVIPNCDAAIAVFWCRLGSPTDKHESGTVEEIEQMLESNRQVFLYFSKENPPYEVAERGIDPRLAAFKERYKDKGIYWEFRSEEEFSELLSRHLRLHYIDESDGTHGETLNVAIRAPQLRIVGVVDGQVSSAVSYNDAFVSPYQKDVEPIRQELHSLLASAVERYAKQMDQQARQKALPEGVGLAGSRFGAAISTLANNSDLRIGTPVNVDDSTKRIIGVIAEKDGIDLPDGFLSFTKLSHMPMGFGETQYYGSEVERRRYEDIIAVKEKALDFCLWKATEQEFSNLSNVVLALENAGTAPDEDVDVFLTVPPGFVIAPASLPRPDDFYLSRLEATVGLAEYFAPKVGLRLKDFASSEPTSIEPRLISYSQDERIDQRFIGCFPYSFEEKDDMTTIRIHFSAIKQHTAIAFPTPLFLTKPIASIHYEIISRNVGDIVSGEIDVVCDNAFQG